jgi:uncharacterized protein (UPF0264 family)
MADVPTIAAVLNLARSRAISVPISVALGEALEWSGDRQGPELPAGIAYVKLGTARLHEKAAAVWQFAEAQERFGARCADATIPVEGPKWIAVAYADHESAESARPEDVAEVAYDCDCAGLLVDTFSKQNLRLLDYLSAARLAELAARCHEYGLQFALAGRLQKEDLPRVVTSRPDVVGIRSAACKASDRNGPIDADAIRSFRAALHDAARGTT